MDQKHVVIIGGGFAGLTCARKLSKCPNVRITLIDKNNYHQFQPLLYQVATAELGPDDVASPLRMLFANNPRVTVKMEEVTSVDPKRNVVLTREGHTYRGDYLVLAVGAEANFFGLPGAESNSFPLYSLDDAERLRSRILAVFECAARDQRLLQQGALNFVVVGAGSTGTELAGALADMVTVTLPREFPAEFMKSVHIYLVDYGPCILPAFSKSAQEYAVKILRERGVEVLLGVPVKEVSTDRVLFTDGRYILTKTVVWAAGLKAVDLSKNCGIPVGKGGRIDVSADLTVAGFPHVYALGDFANTKDPDGKQYPQLASVAEQAGGWAAKNIMADMAGMDRKPFRYRDKGIMTMVGRNAAVAEVGRRRFPLYGALAFFSWLFVHALLMTTVRQRCVAFIDWTWVYFGKRRELQVLDRSDAAKIDWRESLTN